MASSWADSIKEYSEQKRAPVVAERPRYVTHYEKTREQRQFDPILQTRAWDDPQTEQTRLTQTLNRARVCGPPCAQCAVTYKHPDVARRVRRRPVVL